MGEIVRGIVGLRISEPRIIGNDDGLIYRVLRENDPGFTGFGEAYFSEIKHNSIKAWKTHKEMWVNLLVPVGKVKFVLFDQRNGSETLGIFNEFVLSPKNNYRLLTVPPGVTFGFKGIGENVNLVLNIASMVHSDDEVQNLELNSIEYSW